MLFNSNSTVLSRVKLLLPKIDFKETKGRQRKHIASTLASKSSLMPESTRVMFSKVLFACQYTVFDVYKTSEKATSRQLVFVVISLMLKKT